MRSQHSQKVQKHIHTFASVSTVKSIRHSLPFVSEGKFHDKTLQMSKCISA